MNILRFSRYRFTLFTLFTLFTIALTSTSHAQSRDSYDFKIETGEVLVTPARCINNECETLQAKLSGYFVGFLPGGASQLFFTSSNVVTAPDIHFQLPSDPNESSGGTRREATFTFNAGVLSVKGVIDSRAFDGPLIEYTFNASVSQSPELKLTTYTARPDYRKCVSPLCGGYFVKAVNKKRTQCADGTRQKECYVATIEPFYQLYSASDISNKSPLLVKGFLVEEAFEGFGKLGSLKAKAVFESATEVTAKGRFFGIENNGIVCITTPCFSYDAAMLNKNSEKSLSRVNFESSGADKDKVELANQLLANGEVLNASGRFKSYDGFSGKGLEFVVHQFYLPSKSKLVCEEGYENNNGACETPYGCVYPQIELTAVGGAALVDPITGEMTSNISKSCVKACEFPGELEKPAQCVVHYP
ncbi:hypothetical protein SAMN02745866_03175 [Alteromonadaceae bacterium Bs31]|nr:hypothetical protein SAMN02745866_03175 [Alteromonadaceae bacterium Bs31]